MAFDDLPLQPPINPRADAYAAKSLELSQAVAEQTRCLQDVAYGPDYWQRVDVYLPEDIRLSGLPVLLSLHGGGWRSGYKEWMGFGASTITSLPAIFVSVSYRLAPTHRYPVAVEDCFRALQWVYRNIAKLGGDPKRIFVSGHSAGAHLCSLLVFRGDLVQRFNMPADVVKGCFPFSGLYDFTLKPPEAKLPDSALSFLGNPEQAVEASPITYVAGNRTPFFVTWAAGDNHELRLSSEQFVTALRAQPGRVDSHVFPDFDHFSIHLDHQMPDSLWVKTVREWMSRREG
jgi:arylformamidase